MAEEQTVSAPTIGEYGPLLQDNVFKPRVMPPPPKTIKAMKPPAKPKPPAGPDKIESWHDWKFNGLAQLDQQTYALMDQAGKKESRFVRAGDQLDDAIVERVGPNEVTIREAGGNVVRIPRVDAMAALLQSVHSTPTLPRGAAPAPAAGTPAASVPGMTQTAPTSSGQILPPVLPPVAPSATAAVDGASQGRRGRSARGAGGAGFTGDQ
jgi:hypothetical protein